MNDKKDALVGWFLELFASRTPPRSILEALPAYRVGWGEILTRMRELGYTDSVVDLRLWWQQVFDKELRRPCNRLLVAAGEKRLKSDPG